MKQGMNPGELRREWKSHLVPQPSASRQEWGAAILHEIPGEEETLEWREKGGGVVRILEEEESQNIPWEMAHDGVAWLAMEGIFAWERVPAQVEWIEQIILGRPMRLAVVWSATMEEEAACLTAALGSHLAAGRVVVKEFPLVDQPDITDADCVVLLHEEPDSLLLNGFVANTPWVFLHGRQVAQLARQVVRQGAGQSLAISGLIPSPALLLFWQNVWRVLLVDGVQDLAKAVAVGRAAMASLAGEEHWQSILVFTRLALQGQVEFNRIHLLPLKDPRFLYAGERIRGINGREIFRHQVWQQVEGAFLQGKRLVGLTGPAGAGKSVMAHLLMERLHRHPHLSEEGRRVVWLNAGVHGGTPSLWQHLADLFTSHGFHADPHWLEEQTKPSPLQLALMFKRLMGSHGWLVVDQCHATQRPEGGWRDPDMAALLTALITQTGWRCLLTSRAPFDLCHDHNVCAIHWLTIPTLTWTERAALAVSEQEVGVLSDPHYLADRLVSMVWWGDPYPLHFRLSLREAAPIMAVEEEANERLHQLLKGLLAQADPAVGFLLQILSLLHFVPEVTHLGGIWRMVGAKAGWQRDMYAIHVGQLEAMGLVEIMPSGRIWMASSVREWVAESIDPVSSELLQRDLAILFHQYSEQIMGEATSLQPMAGKKRGDGEVLPATLFRKAGRMLDYALLHALQQSDTELIAYVFQDVLEQETSHVYRGRLFRQAMEFWQILEGRYGGHQQGLAISAGYGVAAKAFILVGEEGWASRAMGRAMDTLPADAPPELAGGLYYQWGLLHQSTKEWGKAEEALQHALLHFQAARHGHGESSVRRVLQHLAEKRGASL